MKYTFLLGLFGCWSISATAQQVPKHTSLADQLKTIQKIVAEGANDSVAASKAAIQLLPQLDLDNPALAALSNNNASPRVDGVSQVHSLSAKTNDNAINNYIDGFFKIRSLAGVANGFDSDNVMRLKYVLYNVQNDQVRWAYYKRVATEQTGLTEEDATLNALNGDLTNVVPTHQRHKYDSLLQLWRNVRQGELVPVFTLYDDHGGQLITNTKNEKEWVIQVYVPTDTASMRIYKNFCALAQQFEKDTNFIFMGINLQPGTPTAGTLPQYHLKSKDISEFRRLFAIRGNARCMAIRNGYFQMASIPDNIPEDMLTMLIKYNSNLHYPLKQHEE
ncbi:MAG: hypothetical protein J7623_03800 [Chitinophaga sp.]|uniref:hypothetical protein n=1 Tax=Chitinophaga sp. TaxID=1869181 RepID=UPI001B2563CC|nr:hypothetical protein [Chitinophaga sp.]MBO9727746.1 hypothetical protein [Chitinophaga sp.]